MKIDQGFEMGKFSMDIKLYTHQKQVNCTAKIVKGSLDK